MKKLQVNGRKLPLAAGLLLVATLLSACEPKRVVTALPIPPERIDCVYVAKRPSVPPELTIDWSGITTVQAARQAHEAFVSRLRTREGIVAGYVLQIEGRYFACASDAQWLREWNAETVG